MAPGRTLWQQTVESWTQTLAFAASSLSHSSQQLQKAKDQKTVDSSVTVPATSTTLQFI